MAASKCALIQTGRCRDPISGEFHPASRPGRASLMEPVTHGSDGDSAQNVGNSGRMVSVADIEHARAEQIGECLFLKKRPRLKVVLESVVYTSPTRRNPLSSEVANGIFNDSWRIQTMWRGTHTGEKLKRLKFQR
ncbi:hypothetical protein MRX96_033599 [Rhipicephalus microplus]